MERQDLLTRAATWMRTHGWKPKLAKRQGFEQTLFEHDLGRSRFPEE